MGSVERKHIDLAMAMHWIDRYAAGVDDECQLDLVAEAFGVAIPDDCSFDANPHHPLPMDASAIASEAGEIVRELQSLLLHASVMGMECTYNGKRMRDVVSEIVAAQSPQQMLAALSQEPQ